MHENKYYKFKSIPAYEFAVLLALTVGLFNSSIFYDETYAGLYFL